ncbi:MAG TPA: ribosome assembly cofactor RimP [Alphaproteobacteria bacterium]|mgnify:CR=1 FL=1|nr:ribosome assembly cofactor RimP [Alphaproteobacteria bacterium]
MAQSPLENQIEALLTETIDEKGFELIRISYRDGVLQIMAEPKDRGLEMTVEHCASISRSVAIILDEQDPITSKYQLEVTSPGVSRPLMKRLDYVRFQGELVKLTTQELIDGRRRFHGRLIGLTDDDKIELDTSFGPVSLDYGLVETAKLDPTEIMERRLKARRKG